MKAYRIVLFIVGVMAGLALLSLVFPKDGIRIGSVRLEFPTLEEVVTSVDGQQSGMDVNEKALLHARQDSVRKQKDKAYVELIRNHDTHLYMPKHDLTYLDDVFCALDSARKEPVRIMHFGDSQLEEDRISSDLRERLQAMFGGGGVGMQPALQLVPKETVIQTTRPDSMDRKCVFGGAAWRGNGSNYGPLGQSSRAYMGSSVSFMVSKVKRLPHVVDINKVCVALSGSGSVTVEADGKKYELECKGVNQDKTGLRMCSAVLDSVTNRVKVTVNGTVDIYGISLENSSGVTLDNIPMRGCSGQVFTKIKKSSLAPFFEQNNVRLIIMQYGGNSMYQDMDKAAVMRYVKGMEKQVQTMKELAPKARILFVGPADMATSIHGRMQTYPAMEDMVAALRDMCDREGCAFWDMYGTMGGSGSIVKWVDAQPPLACRDYIHFTPRGAQKMGVMLFEALKVYYEYYRFRLQR